MDSRTALEIELKDNISPMATKELTIQKTATSLVEKANEINLTKITLPEGVLLLSKLNQTLDSIELEEDTITAPAQAIIKRERERWTPFKKPLKGAIDALRAKMTQYQTLARKEEQEAKDAIAARVKEGRGNLTMETALERMDKVDAPESRVATDAGSLRFQTKKEFEVMDVTLLPVGYLLANEVEIRKAMKNGIELPGVRYFTVEIPVNTR
jgi:hypothetical protein